MSSQKDHPERVSIWHKLPYSVIFSILVAGAAWAFQYGQLTERTASLTEIVKENRDDIKEMSANQTRTSANQETIVKSLDKINDRLDKILQRDQAALRNGLTSQN